MCPFDVELLQQHHLLWIEQRSRAGHCGACGREMFNREVVIHHAPLTNHRNHSTFASLPSATTTSAVAISHHSPLPPLQIAR
jgi:hypothetical protein